MDGETISVRHSGGQAWFLIVGFLGFAVALASIADMFSARPFDGIVPVPYGRDGIGVRAAAAGSPAEKAGIHAGEMCGGHRPPHRSHDIRRFGRAAEARHRGSSPILVKAGPCASGAAGEIRQVSVRLTSERLGGKTYLYYAGLGFLFFLIGFFVFWHVPDDPSARIFFLLCVLFLLFFVCRLRPASYWWIDVFVQNTGTISLFLLPAVFLHFFLIFPRPKRLSFAVPDEWTGDPPPAWKRWLQEFLSASPGLLYLIYAVPPVVFLYDVSRQVRGEHGPMLSGAPLSSWILLGDYLVLGLAALAHSAFTLRGPARTPTGLPCLRRHDPRHRPLPAARHRAAVGFWHRRLRLLRHRADDPDPAHVCLRDRPFPDAQHPRHRAAHVPLRGDDGVSCSASTPWPSAAANALFASSRLSRRPLFNFGFFLVIIPLFEFVRRRLQTPLDKPLLSREVRLPVCSARDERGDHGRARSRPHRGLPDGERCCGDAGAEGLDLAARRDGWLERRGRREDRLSPGAAIRRVLRREGRPVAPR